MPDYFIYTFFIYPKKTIFQFNAENFNAKFWVVLKILKVINSQAPYQTLMKLKVFYKGYFRQNKGCFIEILTKIKSKLTSIVLVFLSYPDL